MNYERLTGVPDFTCEEYALKQKRYALLIPVINEGDRIRKELERAREHHISECVDIVICDGGSHDGSTEESLLRSLNVNTLLVKLGNGKQGAQLRMGFWWALKRDYEGLITIDGNNKDSIEDVPRFIEKLEEGYDFVQGSRFIAGGRAINTPFIRFIAVKYIHAPIISLTARQRFTDTTNAFRAYSIRYLRDVQVNPFRDVFVSYELLAYLSVRASQLGYRTCEIPVTRKYPVGRPPTKISMLSGNVELMKVLIKNFFGDYNPK